jgi:uncharacterized protein HemX
MSKGDEMKVSSETAVSMPMKNLISIIMAVAVGVWAYFGVQERLNRIETNEELLRKDLTQATERIQVDLEKNTEFRIKWPRGEMGTLPADSEQYMLIEHIAGQVEKIQERMEDMMNNGVNIKRLQQDVESLTISVEKLKDSNRNIIYQNGNGHKKKEGE